MTSIEPEVSSRGGFAVALFCFFVFGFLFTFLVQTLVLNWQGSQINQSTEVMDFPDGSTGEAIVKPASRFNPQEVVNYQMKGLSSENRGAGIRQCFAFASPTNKIMTGPLSRFARMVQAPPYNVLMAPQELLVGSPDIHENHATVTVTLLDSHGEVQVFQFVLSKQGDGEFSDCWMTEGVYPLRPRDTREIPRPPTVMHIRLPGGCLGQSSTLRCQSLA